MKQGTEFIIVEPSTIAAQGLIRVVSDLKGTERIWQTNNFAELEKLNRIDFSGVVLMNPCCVFNVQKEFLQLKSRWPMAHWLAFVFQHYEPVVLSLFEGVISIFDPPETVLTTIRSVISSEPAQPADTTDSGLSDRELEVLKCVAEGLSNKEMADRLNISVNTVITHRKNISQKTGIKSASGLTIYAVVNKIIHLDVF